MCTGTAVSCDDGDGCTTDSCDPATGACVHALCDQGTACEVGTCDPNTHTCSYAPVYVCSAAIGFSSMSLAESAMATPWDQAGFVDGNLRLTWPLANTEGMAFFAQKQSAREGFTARFSYQSSGASADGGGGLAFVLQNSSTLTDVDAATATATVPYDERGLDDPRSIAVEVSGEQLSVLAAHTAVANANLGADGNTAVTHAVEVTYAPGDLTVSVDGTARISDAAVDLAALGAVDASGQAWVGFTARSGTIAESNDVSSFQFIPTCPTGSCGTGAACTAASCDAVAGCQVATVGGGDTDGDFICDDVDACPNSATGDSDGNGTCDDVDVCDALQAIALAPAAPQTGQAITASVDLPASVLAGVSLDYAWTENDAGLVSGATLPGGTAAAGDALTVNVTAAQNGRTLCTGSKSVVVGARTPACTFAHASYTRGSPDVLTCTCDVLNDPDQATTGYTCSFTSAQTGAKLGSSTSSGGNSCALSPADLPVGAVASCSIAPTTSSGTGTAASATAVTGGVPPVAPADLDAELGPFFGTAFNTRYDQTYACQSSRYVNTAPPNTPSFGDPDGVWSTWRFRWSVNGEQVLTDYYAAGAADLQEFSNLTTALQAAGGRPLQKGDVVTCTIDLWDGAYASSTSASASQTLVGTSVKIDGISLNPDPPTSSTTETCTATLTEYDVNDTASVDLVANATGSASDGGSYAAVETTIPGSADGGSHQVSITFPAPAAGQTVGCYVTASDPDSGDHTRSVGPETVVSAPPQIGTPVLRTSSGDVCSPVICEASVTDPDTASGTLQSADVQTTWLVDGQPFGTPSVTTYSNFGASGATALSTLVGAPVSGKSVACEVEVRADASSAWSAPATSDALTLVGTPPSAKSVAVSGPAEPRAGDTLTCSAQVDPGSCTGATYSYLYQWAIDGQVLDGQTGSTLSGTYATGGGQVTCSVAVGISGGEQSQDFTASPALTLAPSTWTVNGDAPGSYFGMSVAVSDDIDGDGYGELVIGEPWASPSGADGGALTSAGKVFVLPGSHSGTESIADYESGALAGAKIFTGESGGWDSTSDYCTYFTNQVCQPDEPEELDSPYRGPVGDALGTRVLAAGDMDGDGVPDLVFSAPWALGSGGYREGRVYVVSGKTAQGGSMSQYSSGELAGWAIDGEVGLLGGDISKGITTRYGELAGWSIAAGDFNGDGLDDLAIGAPEHGGGWSMESYGGTNWINAGGDVGRAYVSFGSTTRHGVVWMYDVDQGNVTDPTEFIEGAQISPGFECDWGSGLTSAGQIDGDGKDALLFDTTTLGTPWLIHGAAIDGGTLDTSTASSTAETTLILPEFLTKSSTGSEDPLDVVQSGKYMWTSLSAGVGDVNGDGRGDVALVWAEPSPYYLTIAVFTDPSLIQTNLDAPKSGVGGFVVYGLPKEGWTESSFQVVPVGDVDGDGLDDFAFWLQPSAGPGAAPQTTRIYVVYGKKDGAAVSLQDIESGAAGFTIETGQVLDPHFAVSAGDLDGDGLSDIVWGAPYANGNTGQVGVYFGRDARGKVTGFGSAGDDTLTGTSGPDDLVGGAGNDTLIGNGGPDVLIGGAGDDVLEVADSSFARVRGGRGTDTLKLDSGDLNLADKRGLISDVEVIDLSSGGHTLTLSDVDVLRTSTTTHTLYVLGDASDKLVTSGGDWVSAGTVSYQGHTLEKFASGHAVLAVEDGISTSMPPTFTGADTFTLPENSADGTPVGQITAVDPDGTIASLSFGDGGNAFGFDPATGNITVADSKQLDFESHPTWNFTVTATDNSGLSTTGNVTINLTDVPEPPSFVASSFTTSTDEGADDGTALLELGASDPDHGDVITWSITSGNDDGAFALDSATGALTVADGSQLDYETEPTRTLTVKVTDSTGLSDTATVTVNLIDVTSFDKTITGTYSRTGVDVFDSDLNWAWSTAGGPIDISGSQSFSLPSNSVWNGSIAVNTSGSISYQGSVVIDGNGFNVSVPLSTHLQFPDSITAGQPFQVTGSTALTAPITLSGAQPEMAVDLKLGLNQVAMAGSASVSSPMFGVSDKQGSFNAGPYTASGDIDATFGGTAITATRLGDKYPGGVTVGPDGVSDYDLAGAAYAMTGTDTSSQDVTLTNPDIYYTNRTVTQLYNGYYDWNNWLQQVLPDWGSIGSGKVTIPLGAGYVQLNWDIFPGSLSGWPTSPSSEYVWAGYESSYALEWTGTEVTLHFEDGTSQVIDLPEDGGAVTTSITLPATADVDGDGSVSFTASVVPLLTFYNWTNPYFRVDAYWLFGAIQARTVDEQFNQFSGAPYERTLAEKTFGPLLGTGIQISDNFDAYVDQATAVEQQFGQYNTVTANWTTQDTMYRQSFAVPNLTPVVIKNRVQFQP